MGFQASTWSAVQTPGVGRWPVALRRGRHPRGLRDEQPAAGDPLRVVHGGVRLREVPRGALPSERRQYDPVGQVQVGAQLVRRQQRNRPCLSSFLDHIHMSVELAK